MTMTLASRIAGLIAAQGPISVAQFMSIVLHDPDHGVYAARDPIGRSGDFITAPEISQIFGELIGLWCLDQWQQQGQPAAICLAELGPGRGTLMKDVLRAAQLDAGFVQALDVVLLEASPVLRQAQAQTLAQSGTGLRWVARLDDLPNDKPLFILANEFFDALPVRQYVKGAEGWHERMVNLDADGALQFSLSPLAVPGLAVENERGSAGPGAVYETSPAATALTEEMAARISVQGGAALIIDYGYYAGGFGETLQAIRQHQPCDLLDNPGSADLSAHVDFRILSAAAKRQSAVTAGPVDQGAFLQALGYALRAEQLAQRHPAQAEKIRAGYQRLCGPAQMGSLFKVMAILPAFAPKPAGF